ncbi:AMP-binding protein [Iamia majanohamensis]|uniref:AMP-binding protein n=1 Tax=Iamia majanohamensis TaxID=467976 RepID=A0AAE9YAA0_9ACTN|nr:AMP-binding protein [Iamia majanohamensis]WCO67443.1 AMP-binding protein [Iamia majanohamensis]
MPVIPGRRALRRARIALDDDLVLGGLMERLAEADPDRVLVDEVDGARRTVGEAAALVDGWAGAVAERVAPGGMVVVATPNGYDQLLLCLAASRAGAVPAPVNDRLRPAELEHIVDDADAALVVRSPDELPTDSPLGTAHPADAGDVGAVFYTSGTTGRPKGAELTHRGILGGLNRAALVPALGRGEEAVCGLPMAHIMGVAVAVGLACASIPVRFLPRFDAEAVLDEIEGRRAGIFVGVPAMYRMLLDAGAEDRDLGCVRLWLSGADAMPAALADRFSRMGGLATLPGVGRVGRAVFAEGYGMVETAGGVAARVALPYLPDAVGRVGVPLPGYRTRVVDPEGTEVGRGTVGELQLAGPGVLKGYRGDEDASRGAFTDDGWLRTGDLVRRGPLGVFTFEGRAKDVIVRGGYNVYAVEVEQALEQHPDVAEAAVVGLPDDRLGEVPAAAVTARSGADLDPEELRTWAHDQLSSYKVPVRVVVVDELPHSGTRKVQRAEVRDLFAG